MTGNPYLRELGLVFLHIDFVTPLWLYNVIKYTGSVIWHKPTLIVYISEILLWKYYCMLIDG